QNYKEKFEELNLHLTRCATDLNLGINLKQIFDPKQDEKDQKMDLDAIQSEADEIASMMVQKQDEDLPQYKRIEENTNQRRLSFRHNLQKNIIKISDPVQGHKIKEEEHAFLHIPYYDLILEKRLGQGEVTDVFHGRWISRDHEVAIKVIRIQYLNEKVKRELVNEISMMYHIRYEHILNIFGACMEPNKYALIVEYMSLGSLYDVLKQKKIQLTWPDRWSIANQMIKGINYLHKLSRPIIHRDIKSHNILMTNNSNGFLVKVADFGLAKIKQETSRRSSYDSSVGTLQWKAPELLKMEEHTEASDVYALGIVLWELATECEPYEKIDDSKIRASVLRGDRLKIPPNVPTSFRELILKAWAHESATRPTCQQLLTLMKDTSSELDTAIIEKAIGTSVPKLIDIIVTTAERAAEGTTSQAASLHPSKKEYIL
ncbi:unnamed protein product, partial [Rotaria sp. Silwood1]